MQRIENRIKSYINDRNKVKEAIISYLNDVLRDSKGGCITVTTAKIANKYGLPKRDLPILQLMLGNMMIKIGASMHRNRRNTYKYIICGEALNELTSIIHGAENEQV